MTRSTPPTAWLATFTRRWHCNPDMCHTVDPVSGHSARMGILALKLWPDASRDLLVACLTHDLGEYVTGDVAWPAKQDRELAEALDRIEACSLADMGMLFDLNGPKDIKRLKYLDRLDAYLWTQHHRPDILSRDGWPEALAWLEAAWAEVRT